MTDAADQQTAVRKRNTLAHRPAAGCFSRAYSDARRQDRNIKRFIPPSALVSVSAPAGADSVPALPYDGLIINDDQQRVLMVNAAASRILGCPAAEMLGSDLSRFIPPGPRAAHVQKVQQVQQFLQSDVVERHALTRNAITGLRAAGEVLLAEATITRMATADGLDAHRLVTAQLRDMSNLRNRMASFTERMRSIIDLAPLAVWITDGDRIVYANRASATLFGATDPQGLLGRSIYSLLRPESHAAERHSLSLMFGTDGTAPVINERIVRLDGQARDVETALTALPYHGTTTLQMVISDVTDHVQLHRKLQASRQGLRRFTAGLVEAREAERGDIARELHVELAHRLTAMKMALATLGTPRTPGAADPPLAALVEMIDDTTAAVRRIAANLRPPMLDVLGLNAAIDWLANGWARRMGLSVSLTLGPKHPPTKESASIAPYRILQEAVTNLVRHSKASQVRVALRNSAEAVVLTAQDDGIGLPAQAADQPGSHGLLGMRERCRMLGGQFEIGNTPGGGVGVTVRLPLAAELPGQPASDPPQPTPSKST